MLVFSAVVKLLVDSADPAEIGACVADKDTRGVTTSALSLAEAARRAGVPLTVNRVGSMLTGFFTGEPVVDLVSAKRSDTARYGRFFHGMLERGVFLAASQFEAAFVSLAHTEEDLDSAARAAAETLQTLG